MATEDADVMDEIPRRKVSGKKIVLFVVLPLLLLVLVGGGLFLLKGVLFGGSNEAAAEGEHAAPAEEHAAPAEGGHGEGEAALPGAGTYVDMPEMLVNLYTEGRRPSFLKISVSLEVEEAKDQAAITANQPRIIDNFQTYLRELRAEDLRGSAGVFRLREELLRRVNASVYPAKVKDILFKEMIVQ
ncbi:flagellar basal body-associated FliL family protein [Radicibacter daui]|uniref:flagellar basal body-associated FliL family protein n=1 Tax=Radicibacter daui TaxID=3064829 RepID=UPI0040469E56